MSVARGSTNTAHRLVLFIGCPTDSVLHTDSASGSSDFGYDARLKPEAATTPEQSEGKPSLDSRVVASLWNTKPKGRFFWFVLVSVNRIVIYNY